MKTTINILQAKYQKFETLSHFHVSKNTKSIMTQCDGNYNELFKQSTMYHQKYQIKWKSSEILSPSGFRAEVYGFAYIYIHIYPTYGIKVSATFQCLWTVSIKTKARAFNKKCHIIKENSWKCHLWIEWKFGRSHWWMRSWHVLWNIISLCGELIRLKYFASI